MKKARKSFIALLASAAVSLVLFGCGSGGYGGSKPAPQPGTMPPPYGSSTMPGH